MLLKAKAKRKSKKRKINNLLKCIQFLSFDVIAGAMASGLMIVKIADVNPGFAWWITLALTVWLVYTADHLLDGFNTRKSEAAPKHGFHFKNRKFFIGALVSVGIADIVIAYFYLNHYILFFGIFLGLFCLIYLFFIRFFPNSFLVPKELFVALIYSLGIWFGPFVIAPENINWISISLFLIFVLLTFSGTSILAWFEAEEDRKSGLMSIVLRIGKKNTARFLYSIFTISYALILMILVIIPFDIIYLFSLLIFILMNSILQLVFSGILKTGMHYKLIVESVYLLPALILTLP